MIGTMFPLDRRGEFKRSKLTIQNVEAFPREFFARATHVLQSVAARNISIDGRRINFTGGMLRFVWNWNVLIQIGYGHIDLTETDDSFVISYYASFREMLFMVSALVCPFGVDLFFNNVGGMRLAGKLALVTFLGYFSLAATGSSRSCGSLHS